MTQASTNKAPTTPPAEAERGEIETVIQQWRHQRELRLGLQKTVDALHKDEQEMKSWLLEVFKSQKFEGMIIDQRVTGLVTREVHSVTDRAELTQYILDNAALELLQFRLAEGAIVEREADEGPIPGLELVEVYDLFDRKA